MRIRFRRDADIYDEQKVEDGIFLVNGYEYIVIAHIYEFDDDAFVELEENSKFFHEGMVVFSDSPGEREIQLIFESLEDARDFIKQVRDEEFGEIYEP